MQISSFQRGHHSEDGASADHEGQLRILHAKGDLRAARVHRQHDEGARQLRRVQGHPRRHQGLHPGDQGKFTRISHDIICTKRNRMGDIKKYEYLPKETVSVQTILLGDILM